MFSQTIIKSTSTTTVSTTTICYVSTNTALTACGKKKKRSIFENPETGEIVELSPTKANKDEIDGDDDTTIDSSEDPLLHGEHVSAFNQAISLNH